MENYELFGKEISGLFTIPSGIITTEAQTIERVAREIPEIGILTTKSIGLEPREGNREPILAQYGDKSFINAVGLRNPGVKEFKKKLSGIRMPKRKFLLVSIFGANVDEFTGVAEELKKYADGFELNASCPHSKKYGQVIGQDTELLKEIIKGVLDVGKPVFLKLSPNLDIENTVKSAVDAGVSGITAINTKGPTEYKYGSNYVLSNKVGGISGKAILELGIECVRRVRKITEVPIIGCGGISTAKDVMRYKEAGANYFGIGSALAGMSTQEMKMYFKEINKDLKNGMNNASKLVKTVNMKYRKHTIKRKIELADDLFLIELNGKIEIKPGQFVFLWIPEEGEKPFSIFNDEPITILVKKVGKFTKALSRMEEGSNIYIRGPYGNCPKIKGKILLVGGGTGIAALYLFAKNNENAVAVLGAQDKDHLPYEIFRNECKVYLSTDKGDIGEKGFVTDKLEEIIKKENPDYCINCGPEKMIETAIQKERKYVKEDRIYSSIEYMTMCGVGLCGTCVTKKGYRNCVDGTFFVQNKL